MLYSVLIVGAGQIGALYDWPGQTQILSHGHAFSSHPGFELVGFVDPNLEAAETAVSRWGGSAYSDLPSAFSNRSVDIVVTAVPDDLHASVLQKVSSYQVRLVFAEKPFTSSQAQARELLEQFAHHSTPVVVNFSRRFVPQFVSLKQQISSSFGRLIRGSAYYGKGSLHNGSHLINLLLYLLGELRFESRLDDSVPDFVDTDPSGSALFRNSEGGTLAVWAVDSRTVTIFEFDLLFEKARVRMLDSGQSLEIQQIEPDPVYQGYRSFGPVQSVTTELHQSLRYARENILDILKNNRDLSAEYDDILATHRLCAELRS